MTKDRADFQRVLYVIACAAGPAEHIHELASLAQKASWNVYVVTTPLAKQFINTSLVTEQTGHTVRSEYKTAENAESWPPFDAMVVVPATFNTINKFALGIADNLAVSLLCEGLGRGRTIVAVPCVNQNHLARHPAFTKSLTMLKEYGVHVIYQPDMYPPRNEVPWTIILEELEKQYNRRIKQSN